MLGGLQRDAQSAVRLLTVRLRPDRRGAHPALAISGAALGESHIDQFTVLSAALHQLHAVLSQPAKVLTRLSCCRGAQPLVILGLPLRALLLRKCVRPRLILLQREEGGDASVR